MRIDILWNGELTTVDLADGVVTVGGSTKDSICIEGLPHSLLTLTVDGATCKITAQRSVRIGQALFPARVPRLLIEGEELKLPNDVIVRRVLDAKKRDSRKTVGTAFVAQELLSSGTIDLQQTRAATLTCVTGLDTGRTWPLAFDEMIIGRGDDVPVRVRDRAVSRQHARLVRVGKEFRIEPVVSAMNGAYVNGLLVKKSVTLRAGDAIEVGHTVLRFDTAERAPCEVTALAPSPEAKPMSESEIRLAANPVRVPKAADVHPALKVSTPASVVLAPELSDTALSPASLPPPTSSAEASTQPAIETTLLMSAGVVLTLLAMGIVALVLV